MTISVSGSVITFSDSTTQSTAFTGGGGVTSLNGQTGAVTTTSINSIGCTMWLASTNTTNPILVGTTVSGSNLYYVTGYSTYYGGQIYLEGTYNTNPNSSRSSSVERTDASITAYRPGNNGFSVPASNVTTVSGTWRFLNSYMFGATSIYYGCCGSNYTASYMRGALYVRVS